MSMWVVLVFLIFLSGIVLLNAKAPTEKKTRELFLREMSEFLEGTLEMTENEAAEKSYRIKFRFKGEEFVYEDVEEQGFKDKVHKAYLRAKTPSRLTLTFTEKKRSTKIRTDIFIASEVSTQYANEHISLQVPKYLKDLKVFTNDPAVANKIFQDNKIIPIFKKFKNVDSRGYPFVSLGIVQGEVILSFRSMKTCYPNIFDLREDIPSIDDYLEKLTVIIRKLKEDL